jgi:agmatinase
MGVSPDNIQFSILEPGGYTVSDRLITYYTGFPSFFNAPIKEGDQVQEGMLVVAGVPIDQGVVTSRGGARYGPRGIREASMSIRGAYEVSSDQTLRDADGDTWLRPKQAANIADIGDFHINPTDIRDTTDTVIQGVGDIVKRGGFPVILGGDHYVAYPGFAGFARGMAERTSNPRLGYLHIDSHPDFRDRHGVGGEYTHGTQVRRLSEDSTISYKNMAWVGLNGAVIDPAQHRIFDSGGMKVMSANVVREQGPAEVVRRAMEVVGDGTDGVYVSIDIDVVDGSQSPGTGSLVFSGITTGELLGITEALSGYDVIGAVDMCEVSPPLDPTGRTIALAARALVSLLTPDLLDKVDVD